MPSTTRSLFRRKLLPCLIVAEALTVTRPGTVFAQAPTANQVQQFNIPAQALPDALRALSLQSRTQISAPSSLVNGLTSTAVNGSYTPRQALDVLVSGTDLVVTAVGASSFTLTAAPGSAARAGSRIEEIVTLGSRLQEESGASKMGLSLRDTPQAISITSRESMDERLIRDVNSALELTAGVAASGSTFAGNNPRTGEGFTLRGQEVTGNRDLRIDGFAAGSTQNNLDMAAFQQVEVVKGPSSMLYGQGSLGGFINMVRKKPQAQPLANIVMQAGSYDTYRLEGDIAGALDGDERVLGRLVAVHDDSGSFIDGVDSQRNVAAPSLDIRVAERTRVLIQALYQDDEFAPSLGIPLRQDGKELKAPHISRSFYFGLQSPEKSEADSLHTSIRVDQGLSERWAASLILHQSRNNLLGLADSYGYGFYDDGNTYVYSSFVKHSNDTWAGELRLEGGFTAFGRDHQILLGADRNELDLLVDSGYAYIGMANIYANDFADIGSVPSSSLPTTFVSDSTNRNAGFYAQAMLSVADRTKLLVGARRDKVEQEQTTTFDTFEKESSSSTFRVGLVQEISSRMNAYATYAESFNPILEDLARSGEILEPVTGTGYEFGLKSDWFDGQLSATLALYRQELDNLPIPDPANGAGQSFSISGGLQRTDGLELELSGSPLAGLTLGAAGSWLDSEYIDELDPNYGLIPDMTTSRQASVFASYDWQRGMLQGLGIGTTLVGVGDRDVIGHGENLFVDGYERVDFNLYYRGLPGLDVGLQIRNAFDDTYIERPNSAYAYAHFFGSPRAVLLRVQWSFL